MPCLVEAIRHDGAIHELRLARPPVNALNPALCDALREAVADLKRFKALVEASPDFIAIADLDGTVRYVNPPGRAMVGIDESVDVTTTTIADYLTPEGLVASLEVERPAVVERGHDQQDAVRTP